MEVQDIWAEDRTDSQGLYYVLNRAPLGSQFEGFVLLARTWYDTSSNISLGAHTVLRTPKIRLKSQD